MDQRTPPTMLTVYFDGGCPVCSREIAAYRRQAGAENCVWVDAASCADTALAKGLRRSDALARFHVRRADGQVVTGMRAFALLWSELPRMAWVGRLASIGPMPALLDRIYDLFLRVRPLWRDAAAKDFENTLSVDSKCRADQCLPNRPGGRLLP